MYRRQSTAYRVEMPVQPDISIYVSRTPPPSGFRGKRPLGYTGLDIAPPRHPRASRDLILQTLALPMPLFPETTVFLPIRGIDGLMFPWRQHPTRDLLVPVNYINELRQRDRWRVGAFLNPSVIGLTHSAEALRAAGLRVFASVSDREALVGWLASLLSSLEIHGHGSSYELSLARAIALPGPLGPALEGAVRPRNPLFSPACVRWVLSEALAAPPWPFGLPGRGSLGAEIEQLLFPSLLRGRSPTEQELLRALFVVQEDFFLGPDRVANVDHEWALSMAVAHAFGVHLFSMADERVVRARHMWLTQDNHPKIPPKELQPSRLRRLFAERTGISVDMFMSVTSIILTALRARAIGATEAEGLMERLIQEKAAPYLDSYLTAVRTWLATRPEALGLRIRASMTTKGFRYTGWGSVPTAPARDFLDFPILTLKDGSLRIWSPEVFADRAADLPRFVLADQPNVRSNIGRLFEAYVHDRLRSLDPGRHRVLDESDLRGVLRGQTPDYVVANNRDMAILEVSSMGLTHRLADGNPDAVKGKLDDYRRKRRQLTAALDKSHQIAQRLLGLTSAGSVSAILVTLDAIPNNPAMFSALEGESFVCTADEFEILLDLAEAGWSLPLLVSGWQRGGREIGLGAALADQAAILNRDLGPHRWARAIADQFDLRAA